jgi:hypothetical protein
MTSFTLAGTSGSNQTITDTNTLTIAAGSGISTTGGSTDTVTVAGTDASTSSKGVASFSSSDFDVSSGAVSIKDNAVTLAYMAGGTDGNIISYDASGDPVAIATGDDGQVLTSAGAGQPPAFEDAAAGGTSWQSVETGATFTAVAGNGYPVNTTAQACTVTLPAGSVGDTIELVDYAGTWDTNKVTLTADGSEKIKGSTDDVELRDERQGIKIVYVDATQGWVATTGANETAPVIKEVEYNIEYLVVAGAGGGGEGYYGGGGGAGGYLTNTAAYTAGNVLTIAVGTGGAGSTVQDADGVNGGDSSITSSGSEATVTSDGGGGGASRESNPGADGGSGGGAARNSGSGGSATAGQGNDGGSNGASGYGGGGGGAGAAGDAGAGDPHGADGGDGLQNDIVEATTDVYYAGGGAGGTLGSHSGGQGGGGDSAGGVGGAGTDGLGGGGAGGGSAGDNGGDGGDGIVILRMLTADYSGTVSGNETPTVDGDYTVIKFENTAGGSYTV